MIVTVTTTNPSLPKANYENELWLHRAMDVNGNLAEIDKSIEIGNDMRLGTVIQLDDSEMDALSDFYERAKTNSPLIQVSFSDGSVRHYDVRFFEQTEPDSFY